MVTPQMFTRQELHDVSHHAHHVPHYEPRAASYYVAHAVLAIRRRDFRSHMGFMALMMATLLTASCALGAILIAAGHSQHHVDAIGLTFYWASYGVISLGLLAAAHFSTRKDEPWSLMLLFLSLSAALWPLLWLVGWWCAQPFVVAMWFAATVGAAGLSSSAFLTAFALRLPFFHRPAHTA